MIALHRRFGWFGREQGAAVAIADAAGSLSFADAHALAQQMARALVATGLTPGDRFVLISANRRESLVAYLAASASGTVCTQLNTRLSAPEIAEIIADAAPRIVLVDAEAQEKLAGLDLAVPLVCFDGGRETFTAWLATGAQTPPPDFAPSAADPLFQLYTSGTTGRPAGIILSHGAWMAQLEQFRVTQPHQPGDAVLVTTPLFHIAATITAMAALMSGAQVLLPPRFDADEVLDLLGSGAVTSTMVVPAMIDMLVGAAARRGLASVRGVRRICYGASPITEALLRRALDLFGCDFIQGYGLTETAGVATILMPQDHRRALAGQPELLRSAGRPVMGCDVRIMRADGALAATGEPGEIQISGGNLFSGYFGNDERTSAAWTADGWFRTGDAGFMDGAGYVFVIDRIKDLIITGGENVFPQEVERVLLAHPAIAEAVVYGLPDARWGEAVAAAVVVAPGGRFDEGDVRAFIDARLARFKAPRHYRLYEALPRNALGKVLRKTLAAAHDPDTSGEDQRRHVG